MALAVAAWGPQLRLPVSRFEGVIVLDITQSMNAEDYADGAQPVSRLAAAKDAVRGALQALPCGSRIGLGVFTEYRTLVLLAPIEVCANFRELSSALQKIDGRMAWAGGSEVAKGINWAVRAARSLPGRPAIVFVTDGHEAPPLHPMHRPSLDGKPGEIAGLIVGTGGPVPVPIPKFDPDGQRLGLWGADDVMQIDPYSKGRGGSVAGERYVETEPLKLPPGWPAVGNEHLSQLREGYLRLLAGELGFSYMRLESPAAGARGLSRRMQQRPLARVAPTLVFVRPFFGLLGLLALVWVYRAAVLYGLSARARQRLRAAWVGPAKPLTAGTPR
jgi:mxaL protein